MTRAKSILLSLFSISIWLFFTWCALEETSIPEVCIFISLTILFMWIQNRTVNLFIKSDDWETPLLAGFAAFIILFILSWLGIVQLQ